MRLLPVAVLSLAPVFAVAQTTPTASSSTTASDTVASTTAAASASTLTSQAPSSVTAGLLDAASQLITITTTGPNTAPLPSVTGSVFVSFPAPQPYVTPTLPAWGAFWSYSQPPIPATSTTAAAPPTFTVSGGSAAALAAAPQEREYTFNIGYAAGAPAGFHRRLLVINNQYPGPLIEANQGDTVVVHVNNGLDIPQTIHWHGMRQNGTNVMDGVPGFSQCAIPAGGSFTYRFQVDGEMGTYWYHSHYGNTLADGLVGGLLIHAKNDPLVQGVDYDDDQVVYIGDFMNDDSEVIIENETNILTPYRGIPFVVEPDAVLINGIGQANCNNAQRGVPCTQNHPAEVNVIAGKQTRLRLINHSGQALIRFSIDNHQLRVIEADDTGVESVWVNEIPVGAGQRYSVVVQANQGAAGSSFWIRAHVATFCINPLATVNGVGILRYTDAAGGSVGLADPTTQPWSNLKIPNVAVCQDLDDDGTALVPLIKENAPTTTSQTAVMNSLFGIFVDPNTHTAFMGFGMNGVAYKNYINNPLLTRVMDGIAIGGNEVASVTFDGQGSADLIINVLDPPPIGHPFHLHGRPFYIVKRGSGAMTSTLWALTRSTAATTTNPLRRDTIVIPQWSYAVLRIKLDDPGVWPLHCHIGWHLAAGKMAAVVIGSAAVKTFSRPADWAALCDGTDPNVIGPGRRSDMSYMPPEARAPYKVNTVVG